MVILSTLGRFSGNDSIQGTGEKGLFFYHKFDDGKVGIIRASKSMGKLLRFHLTREDFEKIRSAIAVCGEYLSLEKLKDAIKQASPDAPAETFQALQNDWPAGDWVSYIAAILEYEGDIEISEPIKILTKDRAESVRESRSKKHNAVGDY